MVTAPATSMHVCVVVRRVQKPGGLRTTRVTRIGGKTEKCGPRCRWMVFAFWRTTEWTHAACRRCVRHQVAGGWGKARGGEAGKMRSEMPMDGLCLLEDDGVDTRCLSALRSSSSGGRIGQVAELAVVYKIAGDSEASFGC